MNRYLSSRERESMARLMALVMVEGEAIKSYEKVSDLDKDFMKYLRMSHTFLEKAIARRYNLIDLDAAKQMKRAASQLCVVFVPEREARRRVEEIARMKKTLHLSMSDFEDLCECIMPRLCGVCSGKNFRHCVWKEFLHRYQVEVVNYKADENTCPYSYPQAGWTVSKEWAEKIKKPFDGIVSDSDIDEEQPEDVSDSDEPQKGGEHHDDTRGTRHRGLLADSLQSLAGTQDAAEPANLELVAGRQ